MLTTIIPALLIGLLYWVYKAILRPPPPRICGSPGGPPVKGPRIKLRDGRHLAYKEYGVPRAEAKHKIVYVHGFSSCRLEVVVASTVSTVQRWPLIDLKYSSSQMPPKCIIVALKNVLNRLIHPNLCRWVCKFNHNAKEFIQELGVYIVGFDKPGYGESDPHPNQTVKSLALDIEDLADQLRLGSKFYVIGLSMGGQAVWGCLKYIPHRLLGAALMAPVVNYWWPSFPAKLCKAAYNQQPLGDQWALRVAHYLPWLTYWWNTQKLFPSSSVIARNPVIHSAADLEIFNNKLSIDPDREKIKQHATQQGVIESQIRAMKIGFGKWEFDPMDLKNPFPNNEGSVHLWQGDEDRLVQATLQRYIVNKLPWIHYHEQSGVGHLIARNKGIVEAIMKELVMKDN